MPDERFPLSPEPGDAFVSDEEAEAVAFVVCVVPSEVADQYRATALVGRCSKCGCTVMFQPHAPRKPPKVCRQCAAQLVGNSEVVRAWTRRMLE